MSWAVELFLGLLVAAEIAAGMMPKCHMDVVHRPGGLFLAVAFLQVTQMTIQNESDVFCCEKDYWCNAQ